MAKHTLMFIKGASPFNSHKNPFKKRIRHKGE
nr:MAG TPA: hypothetical protein [Caudoviricetes sp.]